VRLAGTGDLRARFAADRLREIRRLRDRALAGSPVGEGAEGLADRLAHAYEALAAAVGGGPVRHVAFRDGAGDGRVPALVRLVWLALPLEDRLRVFFVTEQRRAERPRAHLLGLPAAEWGRYVPEGTWLAGESEPVAAPSPGRLHWARLLADPTRWQAFAELARRSEVRARRLVTRDDLSPRAEHADWREAWGDEGPTLAGARALVELERRRSKGRWYAVGAVLAEALERREEAAAGSLGVEPEREERLSAAALHVVEETPSSARVPVVRGLVRTLRANGPRDLGLAGRVRCRAARTGDRALAAELHRLVDRESDALRTLLGDAPGAAAVVRSALPLSADGDAVGRELVRLAAPDVAWDDGGAAAVADALDPGQPGTSAAARDLLDTLAREGIGGATLAAAAEALVPLVDETGLTEMLSGGPPPPLAVPLLMRAARLGGREHVELAGRVIRDLAAEAPPGQEPAGWMQLASEAPAAWLGREPVLEGIVVALGAGREPFRARGGDPSERAGRRRLASVVARRVLERCGAAGLSSRQATAVLRLLWLEGDGGTLRWLTGSHRTAAVPLLSQLLVSPAPSPLDASVRAALTAALEDGASIRGIEAWQRPLEAYAPAVAARLSSRAPSEGAVRPPRIFLGSRS
jgi:hypothetical protein